MSQEAPQLHITEPSSPPWDDRRFRQRLVDAGVWSKLSPAEAKVLFVMYRLSDARGDADLPISHLIKTTGYGDRAVGNARQSLDDRGVILYLGKGKYGASRYRLMTPEVTPSSRPVEAPSHLPPHPIPTGDAPAAREDPHPPPGNPPLNVASPPPEATFTPNVASPPEATFRGGRSYVPKPPEATFTQRVKEKELSGGHTGAREVRANRAESTEPEPPPPKNSREDEDADPPTPDEADRSGPSAPVAYDHTSKAMLMAAGLSRREAHGLVSQHRPTARQIQNVLDNIEARNTAHKRGSAKQPVRSRVAFLRYAIRAADYALDDRVAQERNNARREAGCEARRGKSEADVRFEAIPEAQKRRLIGRAEAEYPALATCKAERRYLMLRDLVLAKAGELAPDESPGVKLSTSDIREWVRTALAGGRRLSAFEVAIAIRTGPATAREALDAMTQAGEVEAQPGAIDGKLRYQIKDEKK